MLNILEKIYKNKIFVIIALLIIITLPSTLYTQSDKDKTIVTSSIGIDLEENNEYNVTILAVIPKGSEDINSNLEVFSATGKSLSDALDTISLDIGRKIGLAHCDSIIFSEAVMQNNLTLVLDYFIRTANLSTNPTLIATPDKAKDLLDAVKTSNNLLDLSLKNIIDSQEDRTLLNNVTLDRFYRAYLSANSTFAIPILSIKDENGGKSSGGGSNESGGSSQDQSGGGTSEGGNGGGASQSKQIKNENEIAIVRDGKFVAKLSDDEKTIYNLVSNPSAYQKFSLSNITDEHITNSTLILQETDKIIVPLFKFKDGKPVMTYKIWLSVMLDEIIGESNHSYNSINGIKNFLTPVVKEKFQEDLKSKLQSTITSMQTNHYDILNIYSKFNAFKYHKFQEYLRSLEHPAYYMEGISIEIDVKLNYVI